MILGAMSLRGPIYAHEPHGSTNKPSGVHVRTNGCRCIPQIIAAITFALGSCNVSLAQTQSQAQPAPTYVFSIAPQPLNDALKAFAQQSGLQLIFYTDVVAGYTSPEVKGTLTSQQALQLLLRNTNLTYRQINANTLEISIPDPVAITSTNRHFAAASDPPFTARELTVSGSGAQDAAPVMLEEVVVSAQKRGAERLQDVPVPVSVLNGDALAAQGQVLLREYYASVPGLSVVPSYEGNQFLSIRGIATGGTNNPTVGIMVDDVPYGASTKQVTGAQVPDFDPGDLERVEVLRGPQGTLYGANSMGGLLKFVTKDPSAQALTARVEVGTDSVHHGAEPGFTIRASANIPLTDSLAMRASAFRRQDAGYIDDPRLRLEGINESESYGARWSALWKPTSDFSLKLSALYQNTIANGVPHVIAAPGLGELQQNYVIGTAGAPGAGGHITAQAYSATLDYKLGPVALTAVTGYNIDKYSDTVDGTSLEGGDAASFFPGSTASIWNNGSTIRKFTQEVRLSGSIAGRFDWLTGGFYTREHVSSEQWLYANDATTGAVNGLLQYGTGPNIYQEYAGFADLTYHFTERFDVQVGGRESHTRVTNEPSIFTGAFFDTPFVIPEQETTANAFTYLLTPRLKVSQDLMLYGRFASGYRPGGSNPGAVLSPGQGIPDAFAPDKTNNYELGLKADLLDRRLTIDTSVYYIDWKDLQLKLFNATGTQGFTGNGGDAKSQGVELSVDARPLPGLTVAAWVTYDDAVITHPPTNSYVYLASGERLAYGSRFSGNISAEQSFPLGPRATGYVGGQLSYAGDRLGIFTGQPKTPAPRQDYAPYARTDLYAGIRYESWNTNLYVSNLTDKRALIGGGLGFFPNNAFIYIQPRTIGVSIVKSLE